MAGWPESLLLQTGWHETHASPAVVTRPSLLTDAGGTQRRCGAFGQAAVRGEVRERQRQRPVRVGALGQHSREESACVPVSGLHRWSSRLPLSTALATGVPIG